MDGAFSYHLINVEFHVFYHESYNPKLSFSSNYIFRKQIKKLYIADWTKGITELVYEQIKNQLSASSGPDNSRHFVEERTTHAQSVMLSRDKQLERLWNWQFNWISKNSIDADAQM